MRTHKESFRVPLVLHDALTKLAKDREFKNLSRFWVALGLLAVQDSRRPSWIKQIANADPNTRDYLIEQMLKFPLDIDGMIEVLRHMDEKNPRRSVGHRVTLPKD
jgi:hypothetical protein